MLSVFQKVVIFAKFGTSIFRSIVPKQRFQNFSSFNDLPQKTKKSFYFLIQQRWINIAGNLNKRNTPKFIKPRSSAGYLFVLLPIATFCLGTWQIYRLQWKVNLIAKLESIIKNDPIEFPDQLDSINEMEYVKVKVKGYVDLWSEPQFIFPRSFINQNEKPNESSLFSNPNKRAHHGLGAQLIMPFVITEERFIDSNGNPLRILVNLGWVSRETMDTVNSILRNKDKSTIGQYDKPEEIELVGVIRKTEKREPFTPKQEYTSGYWTRRDIEKLSNHLKTNPILLDAFKSYSIKSEQFELNPIGGQTRVNLRNEHLSYIITWYSLTGIFSYLWYKKIFKSRL